MTAKRKESGHNSSRLMEPWNALHIRDSQDEVHAAFPVISPGIQTGQHEKPKQILKTSVADSWPFEGVGPKKQKKETRGKLRD